MKKTAKRLIAQILTAISAAALTACAAVSFTHAAGEKGRSVTNAEVQPNNTVMLEYPNGSACIDTNPGESTVCTEPGK